MRKVKGYVLLPMICVCALLVFEAASAQDIRGLLFKNTDLLLQQAKEVRAELLSPVNYADAQESCADAELEVAKGRADRAREDLADCDEALRKALETSKLAELTFTDTLQARELTVTANAPRYASELWEKAESRFNDAAKVLERGNIKKAQSLAAEAASEYDIAELAAIKAAILGNARQMIEQADEDKVEKYAPRTLGNAKDLVARADAELDASRYTTAGPQGMAAEAEYQVRHARYIAGQVMALDDEQFTAEDLILQWEKPLRDVAGVLDASTDMTEGFGRPGAESLARAQALTRENFDMAARIGELEVEVGSNELIIEEAERLRRQLQEVEGLFAPYEARILREGNNLIVRLVGLSFPVGQAVIEAQYFGLMRKVQDVVRMFPDTQVLIEGHTDSTGSDNANMKLSQERASAVREYLVANQILSVSRVTAIGYGKTRPIASNETTPGRAENRRIDVEIKDVRARFGSRITD